MEWAYRYPRVSERVRRSLCQLTYAPRRKTSDSIPHGSRNTSMGARWGMRGCIYVDGGACEQLVPVETAPLPNAVESRAREEALETTATTATTTTTTTTTPVLFLLLPLLLHHQITSREQSASPPFPPLVHTTEKTARLTCSLGAFRRLAAGARAKVNASTLGTSADRCPGGSMVRHRESSFCPLVSSKTVDRTRRSSEASRVDASGAGFPSACSRGKAGTGHWNG